MLENRKKTVNGYAQNILGTKYGNNTFKKLYPAEDNIEQQKEDKMLGLEY